MPLFVQIDRGKNGKENDESDRENISLQVSLSMFEHQRQRGVDDDGTVFDSFQYHMSRYFMPDKSFHSGSENRILLFLACAGDWRAMSSIRQRIKCSHMFKFKYNFIIYSTPCDFSPRLLSDMRLHVCLCLCVCVSSTELVFLYIKLTAECVNTQTNDRPNIAPHENQEHEEKKTQTENRGVFRSALHTHFKKFIAARRTSGAFTRVAFHRRS